MSGPGIGDYLISLPERVLRSTSAVAGGLLRELGDAAVPAAVRRTLLYRWSRWTRSAGLASHRTGELFDGVVLDHYTRTLAEIHQTGYLAYWVRALGPYFRAAAAQFSPSRGSETGRFLRRADRRASDVS